MRNLLAACLLLAIAAAGQDRRGDHVPPSPPQQFNSSVVGHVYCADTHGPARLARVTLRPLPTGEDRRREEGYFGNQSNGTTDMDGAFEIRGVAPGRYYVDAQMLGYVSPLSTVDMRDLSDSSAEAQARVQQKVQMVQINGSDSVRVDLSLEHGAALIGAVRFEDGAPATSVYVNVFRVNDAAAATSSSRQRSYFGGAGNNSARTDDRGGFRISGLAPGTYSILTSVSLPPKTSPRAIVSDSGRTYYPQSMRMLQVYAPATFHRSDARQYTVVIGEERSGIEITIPLSGLHTISGSVQTTQRSSDGRQPSVSLVDRSEGGLTRMGQIDDKGSFRIDDVPDGDYTMSSGSVAMAISVHGSDVTGVTLAPPQ